MKNNQLPRVSGSVVTYYHSLVTRATNRSEAGIILPIFFNRLKDVWVYETREEIFLRTGIKEEKIEQTLKHLKNIGILLEYNENAYRFNWEKLSEKIELIKEKDKKRQKIR